LRCKSPWPVIEAFLKDGNVQSCHPVISLQVAIIFFRENWILPAFKAEFPRLYVVSLIAFVMDRK